jgi:hypothetical protein
MQGMVGIAVDNYKIPKFKTALEKAGYANIEVVKFTTNTSILKVPVSGMIKIGEIHRICKKLQIDFQRSN